MQVFVACVAGLSLRGMATLRVFMISPPDAAERRPTVRLFSPERHGGSYDSPRFCPGGATFWGLGGVGGLVCFG